MKIHQYKHRLLSSLGYVRFQSHLGLFSPSLHYSSWLMRSTQSQQNQSTTTNCATNAFTTCHFAAIVTLLLHTLTYRLVTYKHLQNVFWWCKWFWSIVKQVSRVGLKVSRRCGTGVNGGCLDKLWYVHEIPFFSQALLEELEPGGEVDICLGLASTLHPHPLLEAATLEMQRSHAVPVVPTP